MKVHAEEWKAFLHAELDKMLAAQRYPEHCAILLASTEADPEASLCRPGALDVTKN
jgi:hypothetical protein